MPRLADATAYLNTDNSNLKRGLDQGEQEVSGWGGRLGSVLQGVGMSVGMGVANMVISAAQQVGQFMAGSVSAASDLGETLSKTNVLFGDSANQIVAFAKTASTQFGQSKQQALDAAATFATFGKAAGLAGTDLVDFSTGFVGLASDLASFNNTTPEQAIEAIGAALRGESEPLRQYGVLLDDASMRQKALELGIVQTTKEALTPQQKVLAAQALIYEQTSAAQGDFARTSGGLANQQRILDAQMANLQATIGEALLPVVLALTSLFNELVQAVLPPVAAFISSTLVPAMNQVAELIRSTLGPALQAMTGNFGELGGGVEGFTSGPFAGFVSVVQTMLPQVQAAFERFVDAVSAFWSQWGDEIMAVVGTTMAWTATYMGTMMQTVVDIVTLALQLLTGDWEGAGQTLQGILSRWQEFFRSAFDAIVRTIQNIDWGGVGRAILDTLWAGMRAAWDSGIDWFRDRLSDLRNMLPFSEPKDATSPLRNLGRSGEAIVGMIQEGINNAAAWTIPALNLPEVAGAGAGAPISITINVSGVSDPTGVGLASRDGVLAGLRAAGLR
jgi:hypothetical protein